MTHATHQFEPRLGNIDSAKIEAFIDQYANTLQLRHVTDLSPRNQRANDLVRALIDKVRLPYSEAETRQILHPRGDVLKMRAKICSIVARAEYDEAMFWSKNLPREDMFDFARVGLFRDTIQQVDNEAALCPVNRMVIGAEKKVLIIGAGPLPLDAVYIFETTGKRVTCVDADKSAVLAGKAFLQRMGYERAIQYHHASTGMYGYENHPYVVVNNAMVNDIGMWESITTACRADHIAARSASGIYATIYNSLLPQVVETAKINLIAQHIVSGTPATMQKTVYANLSANLQSVAKMMVHSEGGKFLERVLHRLTEDNMRPENYLMGDRFYRNSYD